MSQTSTAIPLSRQVADQRRLDVMLDTGIAHALRTSCGLSLAAVAAPCGVTAPTVWKWENGRAKPRPEAGMKYLALLDSLMGVAA